MKYLPAAIPIAPPKSSKLTVERPWQGYAGATLIVLGATLLAALFFEYLTARVSMILLAGVLVTGLQLGTRPAIWSSLLSGVVYGFFLMAAHAIRELESPGDSVAIAVFLIVSMPTGILAGRARDARLREGKRSQTTEALFQASSALSASVEEAEIRHALAVHIGDAAGGAAFVCDAGKVWASSPEVAPSRGLLDDAQAALAAGRADPLSVFGEWQARPLRAGGHDLGMAVWQSSVSADPLTRDLIAVLVDLGAAAVARSRLAAERAEVEGLARNHDLLSTLLTSISHDFRDAAGSDPGFRKQHARLRIVVSRQRPRRSHGYDRGRSRAPEPLVANLLNMTKLEAGVLKHDIQIIDVAEVLHPLAAQIEKRLEPGARLLVDVPGGHRLRTDPLLFEQAVRNVVDNAARFNPNGGTVRLGAHASDGHVNIEIADSGPGIDDDEASRIFDKFYRSAKAAPGSGTGLGLAITRGLIEGLGGRVSAANRAPPDHGLQVVISMPVATP